MTKVREGPKHMRIKASEWVEQASVLAWKETIRDQMLVLFCVYCFVLFLCRAYNSKKLWLMQFLSWEGHLASICCSQGACWGQSYYHFPLHMQLWYLFSFNWHSMNYQGLQSDIDDRAEWIPTLVKNLWMEFNYNMAWCSRLTLFMYFFKHERHLYGFGFDSQNK